MGRVISNALRKKGEKAVEYLEKPYPLFEKSDKEKTEEERREKAEAEERRARAYMMQMDMAWGQFGK